MEDYEKLFIGIDLTSNRDLRINLEFHPQDINLKKKYFFYLIIDGSYKAI
jgi:hypothetical protein